MANSRVMEILLRLRDEASATFRKTEQAMGQMQRRAPALQRGLQRIGNTARSLSRVFFNLKTAIAGALVGAVSTMAVRNFISAANEQQRSVEGMETAMRSMGRYTPELSKKLQQLAQDLQKTTNFGDEATMSGMKFLLTYRDIGDEMLPRTSKAMLDLAALMGGDTKQAANMLGKASMGMTGELRRVGITVDANVYKLRGYEGVLEAIESQVSGQAEAMRRATGPWISLGNIIGDLREELGYLFRAFLDSFGEDVINAIDFVVKAIQRFRDTADFKEWAERTEERMFQVFSSILVGAAKLYDYLGPVMAKIGRALYSIWEGFRSLPGWVQEVGLVMAVLGGKKGLAVIAGISLLTEAVKNQMRALEEIQRGRMTWGEFANMNAKELAEALEKIENTSASGGQIIRKAIPAAKKSAEDFWAAMVSAESAEEATKIFLAQLSALRDERKKAAAEGIKDAKKPGPAGAAVDPAVLDAQNKAALAKLKETTQTQLLVLENSYKDGLKSLEQYFEERRALMVKVYEEEIRLAEAAAKATTDPAKRIEADLKVFSLKEQMNRDLIKLDRDRLDAQKSLEEQAVQRGKMLEAIRLRNMEDASGNLKAMFTQELAEMDIRHQEEIERLKTLNAKKEEIDEAYRLHKIEKDRLLIDQERRLNEYRLDILSEMAGGMASIFNDLYEGLGKKNKEFFYISKAAAIAEATINIAQAITKAMAQGGIWGIAQAAVIGAQGAMQIAKITAQQLAEGGMVKGSSPSPKADDKLIAATSGEYMHPVEAVRYYGVNVMEAIRKKLIPREVFQGFTLPSFPKMGRYAYAEGGMVSKQAPPSGGPGQAEITIANFVSYDDFERFLSSARGQRAVLNVVGQNPMTIRRALS
jgi:hypothetical protein